MNKNKAFLNPGRIIDKNAKKECFESTITSFPEDIMDKSFNLHKEE